MSWYKKSSNVESDTYSTQVRVNVYGGPVSTDVSVAGSHRAVVKFGIDIESRGWGIKSINVTVFGTISVPLEVTSYDELENETIYQKEIEVDLSRIPKEEMKDAGLVTVGDLDLWINENFEVLYEKSNINILNY